LVGFSGDICKCGNIGPAICPCIVYSEFCYSLSLLQVTIKSNKGFWNRIMKIKLSGKNKEKFAEVYFRQLKYKNVNILWNIILWIIVLWNIVQKDSWWRMNLTVKLLYSSWWQCATRKLLAESVANSFQRSAFLYEISLAHHEWFFLGYLKTQGLFVLPFFKLVPDVAHCIQSSDKIE
jgi:hypothetical protein